MSDQFKKSILFLLILIGLILAGNLFHYCLRILAPAGFSVVWLPIFINFALYTLLQIFFVWYLYCRFQKRKIPRAPSGLAVDVFVTAYNEPLGVVKKALQAATNIHYPHRTYLLDDSPGCLYRSPAEETGCEYLAREGNQDHKAGNVNAALAKPSGDFVADLALTLGTNSLEGENPSLDTHYPASYDYSQNG